MPQSKAITKEECVSKLEKPTTEVVGSEAKRQERIVKAQTQKFNFGYVQESFIETFGDAKQVPWTSCKSAKM